MSFSARFEGRSPLSSNFSSIKASISLWPQPAVSGLGGSDFSGGM
ncbi:hypothetical protein [uncultured Kriegella sp.]